MFYDVDVFDCDGYGLVNGLFYFFDLFLFHLVLFFSLSVLLKNMERESDNSISIYVLNFD